MEVTVPGLEIKLSRICVLGVPIMPLSTLFLLSFGHVPTAWYVFR